MLIDLNARVGEWPFKALKYNTCPALLARMDHFGVDMSVISQLTGIFYKNTQPANENLYREWNSDKKFRKRLIPFAVINPSYAGWLADLATCHEKWKMKGICLYPRYHDYDVSAENLTPVLTEAMQRNMAVRIAIRMEDSRARSWMDIRSEDSLSDFTPMSAYTPDCRILFCNVANTGRMDDTEVEKIKKGRVLLDTSGRTMNQLPAWIERYGIDKIAFGTHSPVLDYLSGRLRFEMLEASELPEAHSRKIRYENAMDFLNL